MMSLHPLAKAPAPGGAIPSIPLSFSLATILPPEPKDFDFSSGAERFMQVTTSNL